MGAEFVAAVQIIVYGGADHGALRLRHYALNAGVEERTNVSKMASWAGLPLTIALMGFIAAAVARSTDRVQAAAQTGHARSHESTRGPAVPTILFIPLS